jgi:glycosyltransferase involved in cell wall biosynthesis
MRVSVFPADNWGCGSYRLIWPAEVLSAQGYDVHIIRPGESSGLHGQWVGGKLKDVVVDNDADVFVFQRVTSKPLSQLVAHLVSEGKTVVVDMDDDLTAIHPDNPAFKMLHPKASPHNNWQHATNACKVATLVTVSTDELQRRYGRARSRVLRNCVPRAFIDLPRREPIERTWGWAGAVHSHPTDLPLIAGAVQTLRPSYLTVGYPEGTGKALGLPEDPPATGRVEFIDWSRALQMLSVGVAPLADTRFNGAKSWLKPLEYAAVGVPWVASDRVEYRRLWALEKDAGFLVGDRTRDWVRPLRRLLEDDSLRAEMSEAARSLAAQLTIEEHAWRWMETWQVAYDMTREANRRRASA